VDKASIEPGMK